MVGRVPYICSINIARNLFYFMTALFVDLGLPRHRPQWATLVIVVAEIYFFIELTKWVVSYIRYIINARKGV